MDDTEATAATTIMALKVATTTLVLMADKVDIEETMGDLEDTVNTEEALMEHA